MIILFSEENVNKHFFKFLYISVLYIPTAKKSRARSSLTLHLFHINRTYTTTAAASIMNIAMNSTHTGGAP